MARLRTRRLALMLCGAVFLTGCEQAANLNLFKKSPENEAAIGDTGAPSNSVVLVERDVEVPEVFQVSEQGLWDGRPSLGGVWVAYPDVKDPERVIIRNQSNGKFVIGALFRRERDNPGPKLQVSSDAAAALGMLAGAPALLNVTALRREEVPLAPETAQTAIEPPETIEETPLDPVAAASAAIDQAEAVQTAAITPAPASASVPAPARPSGLGKPYIQIGLFSVEENARRSGTVLRGSGVLPNIVKNQSSGKTYWRVTVGPTSSVAERAVLMEKIRELGYADAYFVTN